MIKSTIYLALAGVLLGALFTPGLARRRDAVLRAVKAAPSPTLMADGSPIRWPSTSTRPSAKAAGPATLMADGDPIPWPSTTTRLPAKAAGPATPMADGDPIPWPSTSTKPPAKA
jgi:hypothetical protein